MTYRKYDHGFRKLIAWQKAHTLTKMVYQNTKSFPSSEMYGITNQLRRASSSIGAQIAEGSRMSTIAHRSIYYERAYASAAEVDNFLELALDLSYLSPQAYEQLLEAVNRASYFLQKLRQSLKTSTANPPNIPKIPTVLTLPNLH